MPGRSNHKTLLGQRLFTCRQVLKGLGGGAATLALCFVSLVLVARAYEEHPDQSDRAHPDAAPETTVRSGGGILSEDKAPSAVTIEEAQLQTGDRGGQIIVVVRVEDSAYFIGCSLIEKPTSDGLKHELKSRDTSDLPPRTESLWEDDAMTEAFFFGETHVVEVFYEDPHPAGEVADPRDTPFFVWCSGLGRREYDEAHVDGTPRVAS